MTIKTLLVISFVVTILNGCDGKSYDKSHSEPNQYSDQKPSQTRDQKSTKALDQNPNQNIDPKPTEKNDQQPTPEATQPVISEVPENLKNIFTPALKFNRYTKVVSPDGGAIHIVAQDGITKNQIIRARSVLQHYLTNYPDSKYGNDKSKVANKMATNKATLLLLNGIDDGSNPAAELEGQPLYYGEIQVEGHSWYLNQDYDHRDATYEEILHMVHDTGIGVDENESFTGALPDFQQEIRSAQVHALSNNIWGIGEDQQEWIQELTKENSLTQEYLAAVIDSYYGLWGAYKESTTNGMWGLYKAKTRSEILEEDKTGAALLDKKFFHPYITYNARIDESFKGNFSLAFNATLPYTHHSQYLKDVTLTGNNASGVIVNSLDNDITGNSADNKVTFSGNKGMYTITRNGDKTTVKDLTNNRDGSNTLTAIENIQFMDELVEISSLKNTTPTTVSYAFDGDFSKTFIDNDRWGSSNATINQSNDKGVLSANSQDTSQALEAWKLYNTQMPYNKSWDITLAVTIPLYWNENGGNQAQVGAGIFVGKPVSEGESSKVYETNMAAINGGERFVQAQLVANRLGDDPIDVQRKVLSQSKELSTLKVSFSSQNHKLSFYIDGEQVGDSQAIDATGLDNWTLSDGDMMDVGIMGFAENTVITNNPPTIDDFSVKIHQ